MSFRIHVRNFILTSIGIILIGAFPSFFNGMSLEVDEYLKGLQQLVIHLLNVSDLTYIIVNETRRPLFPFIFQPYSYSLILLISSLVLSVILAFILVYLVALNGVKWIKKSLYLVSIVEGIPDFFIFVSLQVTVVTIYKNTDILLFNFVSLGENKLYFLPIFFLSLIPTLYLFRIVLESFHEENEKAYVELAIGKGVSKSQTILQHIFRNTFHSVLNNMKPIIWMLLSNLLIVEYIFNLNGITMFIYKYLSPEVVVVSMFLIYVPIFLLLGLCSTLLKVRSEGVVI